MRELTTVSSTLDFWPALMMLFCIAFGPTFIALNMTETFASNSDAVSTINVGIIIVIGVFFLINLFSIMMLNAVYNHKKLGSFQEMAWSTSSGNRGYIFLISAMKVIYLVATSAYCISFVASFFAGIVHMLIMGDTRDCFRFQTWGEPGCPEKDPTSENWKTYVIYAGFVLVFTFCAYMSQKDIEPQKIYSYTHIPKLFFICVGLSLAGMVIGMLLITNETTQEKMIGSFSTNDAATQVDLKNNSLAWLQGVNIQGVYFQTNYAYKQGNSTYPTQQLYMGETLVCDATQCGGITEMNLTAKNETPVYTITGLTSFPILTTFLDYLPYMVFTNMFAIFYLETICMTKKTAKKTEDDQKIGHYINGFISLFFLFIFVLLCVLSNTTY